MLNPDRSQAITRVDEFGADVFLVFVGHPGNTAVEVDIVKGLESEFQRRLDDRLEVMDDRPFTRIKVWEWSDDARATPLGQAGLIAPYLERAQMAIFVFRQRIGAVTWQELEQFCRRPDPRPVLVTFCDDPPEAKNLHDVEAVREWLTLLERKSELTKGWTDPGARPVRPLEDYKDNQDLKRILLDQFNRDVGSVLRAARSSSPRAQDTRALRPPTCAGCIERPALFDEIHGAVESGSIVAIEGLPLSGKSSAAALYLRSSRASTRSKSPFWYEAQRGDTLQDLMALFESEFSNLRLTGRSPAIQCRQLMAFLSDQTAVLVIDEFHRADRLTFEPLLRAAAAEGTPARLIVISGETIRSEQVLTGIEHVRCGGFDAGDLGRYLAVQDIHLTDEVRGLLLAKTQGLPFAVSFFCALIKSRASAPGDLLRGGQQTDERYKAWFRRVVEMVDSNDRRLLEGLSVLEEPFGAALAAAVSQSRGLTDTDQGLKRLERSFLIQHQDADSWKVHPFVADFATDALDAADRSRLHEVIAGHYRAGISIPASGELTDEEFFALERSCRHYQRAGNAVEAGAVLRSGMSKTAKDRGFYQKLKRLCARQLELEPEITWSTYDFAHCCLITGEPERAFGVLESVISRLPADVNLRVQLARLYAEVCSAGGRHEQGLRALSTVLATINVAALHEVVRFQLRSGEIQLLTRLGRYDEASTLGRRYVSEARASGNLRNIAIGLTALGVVAYRTHRYDEARQYLTESSDVFRQIKGARGEPRDRRGLSWALLYLSPCLMECGDQAAANLTLVEALRIREEIDEVSSETREMLRSLAVLPYDRETQARIATEIARLNERLGASGLTAGAAVDTAVVLPEPCLVVLVGVAGSGKTTFAERHFKPSEIVSSDRCRELIADDATDQTVSGEAFEILHAIASKRLAVGRLTVIDATSVKPLHRASLLELAKTHGAPAVAIVFDLPEQVCKERNAARHRVVPEGALEQQIASLRSSRAFLPGEGFDRVFMFQTPEIIEAITIRRLPPNTTART